MTKVPDYVRDPDLYIRARNKVKKRVNVWPSAYASGQVQTEYKRMGGRYKGSRKKKSNKNKLQRWYDEVWVNVCEPKRGATKKQLKEEPEKYYKKCGRKTKRISSKKFYKKYPYCRPAIRVTSKTPKTVGELTKKEIKKRCSMKRKNPREILTPSKIKGSRKKKRNRRSKKKKKKRKTRRKGKKYSRRHRVMTKSRHRVMTKSRRLRKFGSDNLNDALKIAADIGDLEEVNRLIKRGATNYGVALRKAVSSGHRDIVELLLKTGAQNEYPPVNYERAMRDVAAFGDIDVAELLLEAGVTNYDDALRLAFQYDNQDILELLKEVKKSGYPMYKWTRRHPNKQRARWIEEEHGLSGTDLIGRYVYGETRKNKNSRRKRK